MQISVGSQKLWLAFASTFGIDAARPEFATNAERVRNREKVIAEVEQAFSDSGPSRSSPNSTRPASRPARSAPWTRSTTGNRSTRRGWWSTSSTKSWAR